MIHVEALTTLKGERFAVNDRLLTEVEAMDLHGKLEELLYDDKTWAQLDDECATLRNENDELKRKIYELTESYGESRSYYW